MRSLSLHRRNVGGSASLRRHRRFYCESLEQRVLLSTAMLVKDINPGTGSSFLPNDFGEAELGNKLIFAATDGSDGIEPYVSDGTPDGTKMLADINPGSGGSDPESFFPGDGVVYFTANNGTSTQIWKTDGTPAGTMQVTNIASMPDTSGGAVFTLFTGNLLYFTEDGDNQTSSLWVTNGVPGTEQELTNFGSESNSDPELLGGLNGRLLFSAGNSYLWTSDGTVAGTTMVAASAFGEIDPFIDAGIVYNDKFYFGAGATDGNSYGLYLCSSDGTDDGTALVGDMAFGGSDELQDFTISGNTLYFLCSTSTSGFQIFSTDGQTVTQVTSFANSKSADISDLTDVNGTLYFGYGAGGTSKTLYKLVGGTPTQVPLPSDGSGMAVTSLTDVNGTVFFEAFSAGMGGDETLFSSDGNSSSAVGGDAGTSPQRLIDVNGTLFYSSDDPGTGTELHSAIPSTTPPPPPVQTPTVDITESASSINQGEKEKVVFTATLSEGEGKRFEWDATGGGEVKSTGKTDHISVSYAKSDPDVYPVSVQVTTEDNQVITATTTLTVKNVDPTVTSVQASPKHPKFNSQKPVKFRAMWTDPGVNDTFDVLWTVTDLQSNLVVDTVTQSVQKARKSVIAELFVVPGLYSIAAQVMDNFGGNGMKTTTVDFTA